MPAPTLLPDDQKKDSLNPDERHANALADLAGAEKRGSINMDDFERSLKNDTADSSVEDANIGRATDTLREKEWEGDVPAGGWGVNRSEPKQAAKVPWYKKKGSWLGIGGGGAGVAALLFGGAMMPSFLLPSLVQNATATNDTRSGILERRLTQIIEKKMSPSGPCDIKLAACRAAKMPMSMLSAMERKGIVAVSDAAGTKYLIEGNGYAQASPHGYEIDDGKGGKRIISSTAFAAEYKNNPVLRKAFKGAYNMRFLGYNGAYMAKNFFKKLGIGRDGGMAADPELNEKTAHNKLDQKLTPSSDASSESGAKNTFRERLMGFINRSGQKAKKAGGDPILTVGSLTCIGLEMPRFVVGTYRAIQASQLVLLLSDLVLSPGGMQQAGAASGAKVSAIGNLLTERVRGADGALGKSALDSAVLQGALGINKSPVGVSKYAPGYSLVTNSTLSSITGTTNSAAVKGTCNTINTPAAAIAVTGVEAAVGAATLGVGAMVSAALKGIGKLVIVIGGIEALIKFASDSGVIGMIADGAYNLIKDGIGNYVEGARGEELGDALGAAIYTFYPTATLAGGGAVLTTEQIGGFTTAMNEVQDERREEDIATLSPFDVSSQYTFLGSIVSNLSLHSVSGNPLASSLSMLGHVLKSPFSILSQPALAASSAQMNCDNAATFGVDENIAINPAGYPCVGIPSEYLDMSVDEVRSLVSDDLINPETGIPANDSDIMMMMADCSEGDLESVTGCTISATEGTSTSTRVCEDGGECQTVTLNLPSVDERKRAAQSLYLFDMQVENILSGADDETNVTSDGNFVLPLNPGYRVSSGWEMYDPFNTGKPRQHKGFDLTGGTGSAGSPVFAVADGEVVARGGRNNQVAIRHSNGLTSLYLHMEPRDVTLVVGDRVNAGQQIGKVGNYGDSTGAHLHFTFSVDSQTDPQFIDIGEENAVGNIRNPEIIMKMLGIDLANGTYLDGR